jgi:tripeptidyl-peptidase-1
MLTRISTPGSSQYGQHLSFKQAGNMFRNHEAEHKTLSVLRKAGFRPDELRVSPNGEFVRVTSTISKLESVLKCKYNVYESNDSYKVKIFRDLSYELPARLREMVDFVSDTYWLPVPPSVARNAIHVSGEQKKKRQGGGNVTPSLLHSFYHITETSVASAQSTQALFESLGQSYDPSDLSKFQQSYGLPETPIAKVIGSNTPAQCAQNVNSCFEASLDVEFILAIAQNATTWYWSIAGEGDIFLQWVEAVAATPSPPLVHSMSYASLAPEDPKFDVERFNTEMCKLGLKGLTLFVASGDDGVANFQARSNPAECGFTPSFPATSPYVVTVGATQGPEAGQTEVGCSSQTGGLITSGGGFSSYVKRPDFQDAAVKAYFAQQGSQLPPRSKFSAQGRAYPDVCAMGHNYPITVGGAVYVGSGTSASTPVMAGMFTLINGKRLQAGKAPLGWITPTLYSLGGNSSDIFNDITSGKNNCCAGQPNSQTCCQYGFNAAPAWDPMTGWGSVNFDKAEQFFLNL